MLKPRGFTLRTVSIKITGNQTDFDLYAAAGSPADKVAVFVTINSGVVIGQSSAVAAFYQSAPFASSSLVWISNAGSILGFGGPGGAGGGGGFPNTGTPGSNGGDAIRLSNDFAIDNSGGQIFGGGGGGGGGTSDHNDLLVQVDGGGGGGGQGQAGGGAGAGGTGAFPGSAGTAGNSVGPGGGGSGGTDSGFAGGTGGNGGLSGSPGQQGGLGTRGLGTQAAGGLAGKAINLNSHAVTWLGGNNGTQVKGAVS